MTPGSWSPDARERMAEAMRERWKDPVFVDKQIKAMVQRWQNPVYRRRTTEAILDGRRKMPLAGSKGDKECDVLVPLPGDAIGSCVRRDDHRYHVAVEGSAADWSLRVYGFHEDRDRS